ncbi:MAG TPA: YHS domain-containing protein [Planctomycetota bacterium]|nr:YHS domain-containing protein [Planctomycetota bacterium]
MSNWMRCLLVAGVVLGCGLCVSAPAGEKEVKREEKAKDPKDMNTDEAEAAGLCPITKKQSKPVYHADYKDKTYHFCSRDCQKAFKADPAKYFAKK